MLTGEPKTYVVETSKYGEFPMDMLRHDDAQAASPEDQALIDAINNYMGNKDALPKIVLVRLTTSSRFAPNVKRWESFSCRVIECSDPTISLSKSPPQMKFNDAMKGVEADYAEAIASLSPKQAWAVQAAIAIQRELSSRTEKLSPHEARKISAGEGVPDYIGRVRAEITSDVLRREAARAQRRPKAGEAFLKGVREQIVDNLGSRPGDTFQIGDVVYATVRGRHSTQYTVVVDGDRVEKVFA